MRPIALCLGALVASVALAATSHAEAPPRVVAEYRAEGVPSRADDPAWDAAPTAALSLMAQMITPPVGGGATERVMVQAIHDGTWLGMRLRWEDATDDRRVGVDRFRDAVAVGFPQTADQGPTSPFMGDADHPVTIWQWSADLEAAAEGKDPSTEAYQGAEGIWYFPDDEAVSERVRGWRGREPVGVFVATGFGALERLGNSAVSGTSQRDEESWSVVLRRRLAGESLPRFEPGAASQLIVAVWDGAGAEVNGRKSVTMAWTPFELAPVEPDHAAR